jgi:hypothetical protein
MSRLGDLLELATRKIDSEDVAVALVHEASTWFFIAAGINVIFGFFGSEPQAMGTGAAYAVLALWLRRGQAAIPAVLLAFLSVLNLIDRVNMTFAAGGARILPLLVALYVLVLSVRTAEACIRLPRLAQRAGLRATEDGGVAPKAASKVKVYGKKP